MQGTGGCTALHRYNIGMSARDHFAARAADTAGFFFRRAHRCLCNQPGKRAFPQPSGTFQQDGMGQVFIPRGTGQTLYGFAVSRKLFKPGRKMCIRDRSTISLNVVSTVPTIGFPPVYSV